MINILNVLFSYFISIEGLLLALGLSGDEIMRATKFLEMSEDDTSYLDFNSFIMLYATHSGLNNHGSSKSLLWIPVDNHWEEVLSCDVFFYFRPYFNLLFMNRSPRLLSISLEKLLMMFSVSRLKQTITLCGWIYQIFLVS